MNYQRIYNEIINNAKNRMLNKNTLDYYTELHHIVPRCLNGNNIKSNLVLLTGREHYLCHWLLWKSNPNNNSLLLAYHKMVYQKRTYQERNFKISSKQYELLKIANSERMKKNNPMHNHCYRLNATKTRLHNITLGFIKPIIHSEETKRNSSIHMKRNNPMQNSAVVDKVIKTKRKIFELNNPLFIGPLMPHWFKMTINNPMSVKKLHDKSVKTQLTNNSNKRKNIIDLMFSKLEINKICSLYKDDFYSIKDISKIFKCKYKFINYVILETKIERDKKVYKDVAKERLIKRMQSNNPNKKVQ
jgi:hypothetical protein